MQGPGSPEQWEHTSKLQNAHFRKVCAPPNPHPHPRHAQPYLPSANHLLSRIDGLAAPRAALGAPDLLGELGRVGIGGGPVAGGPAQGRACGEGRCEGPESDTGWGGQAWRAPPACTWPSPPQGRRCQGCRVTSLTGDAPRTRGSPLLTGDPPAAHSIPSSRRQTPLGAS